MRVPTFPAALTALLLASCATAPPSPPSRSRVEVRPAPASAAASPAQPARPAWQPRRVVPDGRVVPGGRLHIVKRGETGLAIARAYGVPWSRIVAANRLDGDAALEIGQQLLIPTAPPQPPRTAEQRAREFDLDIDDLPSGTAAATRPRTQGAPVPRPVPPAVQPGGRAPVPLPAPPAVDPATAPRFSWPVEARVILSGFGPKPGGRVNDGINIRANQGAPVRAAADGEVIYAGDAIAGYGNLLLIRHAGGWVTAYGHLETLLVRRGQRVSRGDLIGRVGSSGDVDEPQLHFQTRMGRRPVNPAPLLR